MKILVNFVFIVSILLHPICESASILVVAPFFGNAHIKIMETITHALHDRGHNITIITTKIIENLSKNYRQIKVERNLELENVDNSKQPELSHFTVLNVVWSIATPAMKFILNSPEVKDFIQNDRSHFDLVINEVFFQEFGYAFAQKYKAPVVGVDTTVMLYHIGDFMGNPMPITYASHEAFRNDITSLYGKIENILLTTFDRLGRKYFYLPMVDKLINEHFSCWNISLPKVEEMQNQVSLTLINSHYSFDSLIPLIPGVVQIGGIHIQQPKPLINEVKIFLDEAKEGAVFFSLGSFWKTNSLGDDRINAFINAFKKLKQRVIWKIDGDVPKMENVLTGNWFQQNEILAHPNIKVFISHGGMLSTQEAVHYGKPIIGIPIFWDQYTNIFKLKKHGAALKLNYLTLNTDEIVKSVKEMCDNPEYTMNMKILSRRFRDRLNEPKDLALYWIEYVIRHKGSKFLKSPIIDMSFLEYYLVEIIIMVLTLISTLSLIFILRLISKTNKVIIPKVKTEKHKKKRT